MGDSGAAIESLYHRRYSGFRHGAAAIVGDYESAHDVVQDGFAQAFQRRAQYRGGSLEAWVWRIVARLALDLRRSRRQTEPLDEALDAALVESERDPELASAVRALPPRRRLIVFLRYYADLPYDEIARVAGVSPGTVAATLAQAHDELRDALRAKEMTT
jgi:RNA polymerase sigma-70 factor (ECF subfamily)